MSHKTEKDYIRDTVVAIARGDIDVARESIQQVFDSKGARKLAEIDAELEEGSMMRAGKRHMRSGKHHMSGMDKKRKKMLQDKKHEKVEEMNDTGSDSAVMGGHHDDDADDITAAKGKVKQASGIDHHDFSGEPKKVSKETEKE